MGNREKCVCFGAPVILLFTTLLSAQETTASFRGIVLAGALMLLLPRYERPQQIVV
jgi:hypothetical protein